MLGGTSSGGIGDRGSGALRRSTLHERLFKTSRILTVSGVIAAAAALAGCNTDFASVTSERALRPLSSELAAEMEKKSMPKESPILVRIFKEESELEVWKQDANGQFALLKTYPICRWSGELGPKVKEGDRQAPEGFYAITPGQMNPNSNYYLAFNLGFPNAFDRANDRSGAFLMVHGDCSSSGCYAMTDEQIQEIYTLGRDAFLGGQKSFQVQAYPFHMTAANLAKHRNNPAMPFWRNIKEGNDHFMVSRAEPKVDVCEKHYVFDAEAPAGSFHGKEKCPPYYSQARARRRGEAEGAARRRRLRGARRQGRRHRRGPHRHRRRHAPDLPRQAAPAGRDVRQRRPLTGRSRRPASRCRPTSTRRTLRRRRPRRHPPLRRPSPSRRRSRRP